MSLDIEGIRKRAEAATPGPWFADVHPGGIAGTRCYREAVLTEKPMSGNFGEVICARGESKSQKQHVLNMRFIAHARTDIPALLDELERTRAAAKVLRKWLRNAGGLC